MHTDPSLRATVLGREVGPPALLIIPRSGGAPPNLDDALALCRTDDARVSARLPVTAFIRRGRYVALASDSLDVMLALNFEGDAGAALAEIEAIERLSLHVELAATLIALAGTRADGRNVWPRTASYLFRQAVSVAADLQSASYQGVRPAANDFDRYLTSSDVRTDGWTGCDWARFFWRAGRQAWEPQMMGFMVSALAGPQAIVGLAALLMMHVVMAARAIATPPETITMAGVPLRPAPMAIDRTLPADPTAALEQVNEAYRYWLYAATAVSEAAMSAMPTAACRYLFPRGALELADAKDADAPEEQSRLAASLALALAAEAEAQAVYAPAASGFRVLLPAGHNPLVPWGIDSLRVYCTGSGLWLQCQAEGASLAYPVYWSPTQSAARSGKLGPSLPWPLLAATAAALWRDLRVAGPAVLPERPAPVRITAIRPERGSRRHARTIVRDLPRRSSVDLYGTREWGSEEEREAIRRRAHSVRGFLRHLPPGQRASDNARTLAGECGLVVPTEGLTFVRPHTRGLISEGESVVEVRARGLASLMLLMEEDRAGRR